MPSSLSRSSCTWVSPPLKPACCYGCQQIIRLVIKNLGSIFAQVFRCTGAIGYVLQSTRDFGSKLLFKRPIWSPFSGLGEGSGSGLGHTAGLRHFRHSNSLLLPPVGKDVASKADIKKRTRRRGSHWSQATTRLGPCLCLSR